MKRSFVPLLAIALICILSAVLLLRDDNTSRVQSPMVGKPVPDIVLPAALGGKNDFATAALGGRPAVINFFASWCVACGAEQKALVHLGKATEVAIYGIDYKDNPKDLKPWLDRFGDPYQLIGADNDGRAAIQFGVSGVPETFVIDGAGVIRYHHMGLLTQDEVDAVLVPLIRELSQ